MSSRRPTGLARAAVLLLAACVGVALGDDFAVDWFVVAGGGTTSAAGAFEVHGTIGQPGASTTEMTGGDFSVSGGFWVVKARYPGDLNCDGVVNFSDIDPFVAALSGEDAYYVLYPDCNWHNADCNDDGAVNFGDIDAFVALLSG